MVAAITKALIKREFAAWMEIDWEEPGNNWSEQYARIAQMLDAAILDLDRLLSFIPDLLDPATGIGREVDDLYNAERNEFCVHLRAGRLEKACSSIKQSRALVEELGEELSGQYDLSEADENTVVAIVNAAGAVFLSYQRHQDEQCRRESVIRGVCIAIQLILLAYRKESGTAAMLSILEQIADKLIAATITVQ